MIVVKSSQFLLGCLHLGSSSCLGGWDASSYQAARTWYHPSNPHCEYSKVLWNIRATYIRDALSWAWFLFGAKSFCGTQITRLLPDAVGTTCGQRLEKVYGTKYSDILRVPFRTEKGVVRKWISRFEVWPYLETYTEVKMLIKIEYFVDHDILILVPDY